MRGASLMPCAKSCYAVLSAPWLEEGRRATGLPTRRIRARWSAGLHVERTCGSVGLVLLGRRRLGLVLTARSSEHG